MLMQLKEAVCKANLDLVAAGLVMQTWGNVSGIDRDGGQVVIKPSGVTYDAMTAEQMVVIDLASGEVVEGNFRPSSDTPTHLELYRALPELGGIVHTHSLYAAAWAQAHREIPPLGTTHADFARGPIPCTRPLKIEEIAEAYEVNTGKVIVERMARVTTAEFPAVLVAEHGPFAWGTTPDAAVRNAIVLEEVARLASETIHIHPDVKPISQALLDKHFNRKHGPEAYYGQGT